MPDSMKIRFVSKDNHLFFTTLKKRVDEYFKKHQLSRKANAEMKIKSVAMISMYLLPFLVIVFATPPFYLALILWSIMGIGIAGIGMGVMHDAIHGAYSKNPNVNKWMGRTLVLMGGLPYNWQLQHNILHHTYTNVQPMDEDVQDKVALRFSPYTFLKKYHRLQFIYAFLFYSLTTLFWVLLKDFIQFFKFNNKGVNKLSKAENVLFFIQIVSVKLIYLSVIFLVPILYAGIPFSQVLAGFLLMHAIAGIVLTLVFQLAHVVEGTTFPLPDEKGVIENDWAIHQINTTVNFSTKNKWISWYVGGLNFQIEHHLFPKICHVHYPALSPIVKQTAAEFGIDYMENETFMQALRSHINILHKFGKLPKMEEAIV